LVGRMGYRDKQWWVFWGYEELWSTLEKMKGQAFLVS